MAQRVERAPTTSADRRARSNRAPSGEDAAKAGRAGERDRPTRAERESTRKARQDIRSREDLAGASRLGELWANYSLTIVLIIITLAALVAHAWFGWLQYVADQTSHGQPAQLWGDDGYWIYFGEWTLQNWQSEFLQTLVIVVLSAFFVHRGSSQSKDTEEELQATLDRIEHRLEQLDTDRRAAR